MFESKILVEVARRILSTHIVTFMFDLKQNLSEAELFSPQSAASTPGRIFCC